MMRTECDNIPNFHLLFVSGVQMRNIKLKIMLDMQKIYLQIGCRMSFKFHFLYFHFDFFPPNFLGISDGHGDRLHQDISEKLDSKGERGNI